MLSTFVAFVALLSAVHGQGIVDNSREMSMIESSEVALDEGNYYVQNVATGRYLQFTRPDDTTDLTSLKSRGSISINYGSAYGKSGRKTGTYVGSVFSGMAKCMSAQFDDNKGVDHAAVSYACSVNGGSGTTTLEKAKQFWKLYPCGSGASSGVSLASKKNGKSKVTSTTFTKKTTTKKTTTSKKTSSRKKTSSKKTSSKKNVKCAKSGKWLARHPEYITRQGNSQCRATLTAWRHGKSRRSEIVSRHVSQFARLGRRSFLAPVKRALTKRGALQGTYCIIAVDHLSDMETRAVGDSSMNTYGGYVSMELEEWNAGDKTQQWIITAA